MLYRQWVVYYPVAVGDCYQSCGSALAGLTTYQSSTAIAAGLQLVGWSGTWVSESLTDCSSHYVFETIQAQEAHRKDSGHATDCFTLSTVCCSLVMQWCVQRGFHYWQTCVSQSCFRIMSDLAVLRPGLVVQNRTWNCCIELWVEEFWFCVVLLLLLLLLLLQLLTTTNYY